MNIIKGLESLELVEGYEIHDDYIKAHVSSEKITPIILSYIGDDIISLTVTNDLKQYELTSLYPKVFKAFMDNSGDVLIHDGFSSFTLNKENSYLKKRYNEIIIYDKVPKKYKKLFEKQNIKKGALKQINEKELHKITYQLEDGTDMRGVINTLKMLGMKEK